MSNALTSSGVLGSVLHDAAMAEAFGAGAITGHMLRFAAAWVQGRAQLGQISDDAARAALAAITTADAAALIAAMGAGSDCDGLPVPALVTALRAGLPDAARDAIHTGATSQDMIDTAMVLALLGCVDDLADRLAQVIARLDDLTATHGAAPMMARTRMQAALPATAQLRLDAWARPLRAHHAAVPALRAALAQAQIGGAIGTRPDPALAQAVAAQLGLTLGDVWHTDRQRIVDLGHWLVLVTGALGKIGQDIALMAQQGVGEISLTGGGGSSAMPHKQNPVLAEILVALARYTAGQQGILAQALIHEQERSGAAWALEWLVLPAMVQASGAALGHANSLLAQITAIGAPR